jgi:hypothetical protein
VRNLKQSKQPPEKFKEMARYNKSFTPFEKKFVTALTCYVAARQPARL